MELDTFLRFLRGGPRHSQFERACKRAQTLPWSVFGVPIFGILIVVFIINDVIG
jgi:hypothetical protein